MKAISFDEKTRVFSLRTNNSVYQMQVRDYNTLIHLYYGADVGDCEVDYRIVMLDRGFSGNPYEAGDDRTFSLDVLPQEYSGYGNGDYRINAMECEHEDGSDAIALRYLRHEIKPGKYALEGLPTMFAREADEATTLDITLADAASGLQVHLLYGVFPKLDVITRAVRVLNAGEKVVKIKRAMSMAMDFPNMHMDMIHFYGRHAMERQMERMPLHHGVALVESKRGTSSHQHNPFVILCDHNASERSGSCYGFALAYSGNFRCEVEVDQIDQTRLVMGIHPYHFTFGLRPGETFETPEVIMAYSEHGLGGLSRLYHDAYRSNLIRSRYVTSPRPILVNNWEATYFQFDDEKLFSIAKEAKDLGLDMFVLDDGWFGKRDTDCSGLGDWTVNEQKLSGGLKRLVDRVHGLGLKFGLWVEPEMVSEDSELYRQHPDWVLRVPGRLMSRSRYQLNLDITRKEVRDHVMDQICGIIGECGIDYIKWDMNRSVDNVYSAALSADRQGEVFHRYVLGVYEMMERLVTQFPNLLFENCSGGGGRFDAGMLYYSPQIWCSDNTDARDRLTIQYGTSFGYPISTMGAHVSACPNHQTGCTTPFETRAVVASAGTFGFELDLTRMTAEEKAQAREQIRRYREIEPLVLCGDYYRLTGPYEKKNYIVWQFVSKDKRETAVCGVMLHGEANPHIHLIDLDGLLPQARYQDLDSGRVYSGAALMKAGLPLPIARGDCQPILFRFKRVDGE